jgi:hypothetical protein
MVDADPASVMSIELDNAGDPLAPHSLSANELKQRLGVERAGKPFLAFRNGQGVLSLFVLDRGGHTRTVGRRSEMDVSVSWDSEVSGLHARLEGLGGEWTVVDDGLSMNGTFVNGERLGGRQRLRDGDRIRVGRTVLAYKDGRPEPTERTAIAGDVPALERLTDTQRRVLVALCRPYRDGGSFTAPASNQQIAGELFLSVDAVKMHLRTLFRKFELGELPQNQKRAKLAECVLQYGLISERDLA